MKKYTVKFSPEANKGIKKISKAGDKSSISKINSLIKEIIENPRTGTGHPEQLKGYPNIERWSRRITSKHRLIYDIEEDVVVVVLIISAYGHYDDN